MREYTDCYVAFMDLLGFKALLSDKEKSCEDIASVFDEISKRYDLRENKIPIIDSRNIHFKVMSDSICIYIDSSIKKSLTVLCLLCTHFIVRLLRLDPPIIIRGGISKGNIYSDGDILFGQGLSSAYMLENNAAKYPRIIIPENIIDDYCRGLTQQEISLLMGTLAMDFDRFYCLNYYPVFTVWGYKAEEGERVNKLIYDTLSKSVDSNIREKYLYLQSKICPEIEKAKDRFNNQ